MTDRAPGDIRVAGVTDRAPDDRGGKPYAGVVPAAGASRRMGGAKGLLRLGGSSFARRVVAALSGGGCSPVFVVVAEGDEVLEGEAKAAGATVLVNPDPGDGPITSLRLAIGHLDPDYAGIVYLPLDHALVTPTMVSDLIGAARASGAPVTLPVHGDKRGHPAVFRADVFDELVDPELDGGARTVVHRHLEQACLVPFTDRAVVTDIDTPEAYATMLRGLDRVAP